MADPSRRAPEETDGGENPPRRSAATRAARRAAFDERYAAMMANLREREQALHEQRRWQLSRAGRLRAPLAGSQQPEQARQNLEASRAALGQQQQQSLPAQQQAFQAQQGLQALHAQQQGLQAPRRLQLEAAQEQHRARETGATSLGQERYGPRRQELQAVRAILVEQQQTLQIMQRGFQAQGQAFQAEQQDLQARQQGMEAQWRLQLEAAQELQLPTGGGMRVGFLGRERDDQRRQEVEARSAALDQREQALGRQQRALQIQQAHQVLQALHAEQRQQEELAQMLQRSRRANQIEARIAALEQAFQDQRSRQLEVAQGQPQQVFDTANARWNDQRSSELVAHFAALDGQDQALQGQRRRELDVFHQELQHLGPSWSPSLDETFTRSRAPSPELRPDLPESRDPSSEERGPAPDNAADHGQVRQDWLEHCARLRAQWRAERLGESPAVSDADDPQDSVSCNLHNSGDNQGYGRPDDRDGRSGPGSDIGSRR